MNNPFFEKKKNLSINEILHTFDLKKQKKDYFINDIKNLNTAKKNDISFFHSKNI